MVGGIKTGGKDDVSFCSRLLYLEVSNQPNFFTQVQKKDLQEGEGDFFRGALGFCDKGCQSFVAMHMLASNVPPIFMCGGPYLSLFNI